MRPEKLMTLKQAASLFIGTAMMCVPAAAQDTPIVIRAGTVIDGSGKVLHDAAADRHRP